MHPSTGDERPHHEIISPEPLPGDPMRPAADIAGQLAVDQVDSEPPSEDGGGRPAGFWWLVLLVLVLHTEAVAFSFNLVSPTLVPIATEFATTQVGWMFSALTLVGAVTTPLITRLGDIVGKKEVILGITAVATAGAVLVAVANSFTVVLIGRALEGFLLALTPLVYSLMRDIFPRRLLAFAVTIAASGVGAVTVAGPFIAGYFVDNHGWRSVFWFLAVEQAVGLLLVLFIVPKSLFRAGARLDVGGAFLIGIAIALALLGVSQGATWGWTSGRILGCFASAVVLFIVWIAVEKRTAEPLIELSVLRQRSVATVLAFGFLGQAALGLGATVIPILVQTPRELGQDYGFGVSATGLATFTATAGAATVLVGLILGAVIRRTGAKAPVLLGLGLAVAGSLFIAFAHEHRWQVIVGYALLGITQALVFAAIPALVIAAVPRDVQGISAGMSGTTQSLGGAVGPTVGFAILGAHVGSVVGGQPIFTNTGMVWAYVAAAMFGAAAFLVALAVPKLTMPGAEAR
jgi:MFS family permease